jgi:hypothetical protein
VRWIQAWAITFPDVAGFLTLRGFTWATGATNPFSAAGGKEATVMIENCAFSGAMADVTPLPGEYNGRFELRNVDMTAAPNASIAIRLGAGIYEFSDQQSSVPITVAGGGTGALATINIHASCNPGSVRVPLTFAGKVNRNHPAPTQLAGVLTSQVQLNTLLANTAAASSGFYLLSGFVPAQNAALAGAIIGHYATGTAATNWWERGYADAPGSIADVGDATWSRISGASVATWSSGVTMLIAYSITNYILPDNYTTDFCRYNNVEQVTGEAKASWLNTATYKFQPTIAGWYQIDATYDVFRGGAAEASLQIYKNGAFYAFGGDSVGPVVASLSRAIYLNGTGDYIQIVNIGSAAVARGQDYGRSRFSARLIAG